MKLSSILAKNKLENKKLGGKPSVLSLDDELLLTFEYFRENSTYFSLGQKYNLSESGCYKIVQKTKFKLLNSQEINLENSKNILQLQNGIIDATEVRIERPKKNK